MERSRQSETMYSKKPDVLRRIKTKFIVNDKTLAQNTNESDES